VVEIPPTHATSATSRGTLMAAIVEAQRLGRSEVEAEHLLLALAADRRAPVSALLAEHGLDHERILEALRVEREHSLAAVGMAEPPDAARLAAVRTIARPRWGASTQDAFRYANEGASHAGRQGRHGTTTEDVLYGILSLELGTVPRALAYAGIDRLALSAIVKARAGISDAPLGWRGARSRLGHDRFHSR